MPTFGAMLRVACLTHYPELYGANRSLLEWVQELKGRGAIDPLIVLPREGPLAVHARAAGIGVAVVPFQPWMSERPYMGRPHHRLRQWWSYRLAARQRKRANRAAIAHALPLLHQAGIEVLVANSSAVPIAHKLASSLRLPLLWHVRELPERHYRLHLDAGRRAYGRALSSARCLVAISEAVREDLLRYVPHGTRIEVVPNGVFHDAAYPALAAAGEARWTRGPFTFLQVGLIHPGKAQVEAVEALALVRALHPEVKLVIAGTGRDRELKRRIEELGLTGAVSLPGFVDDVPGLCMQVHALVSTSRDEAFGRSIVEAMATGLPVVGHASGGTPDLVLPGITGLLYGGGARALADRMNTLVDDREAAHSMGQCAAEFVAGRFSIEHTADRMLDLLLQVAR